MIPFVPTSAQAPAPVGFGFAAFVREMVLSWISHHQRLAEGGISIDH